MEKKTVELCIMKMLNIQNELNSRLNPNWKEMDWDFLLAARMEAAEAVNHWGYKWWKPDESHAGSGDPLDPVLMELADVWHFLLSKFLVVEDLIEQGGPGDGTSEKLSESFIEIVSNRFLPDFEGFEDVDELTALQNLMIAEDEWTMAVRFAHACRVIGLSFAGLYALYMGKVALNRFRWQKDYGGSYQKIWDGIEDNDHLLDILKLDPDFSDSENLYKLEIDDIVKKLEAKYKELVENKQ
ncbi:dUTP diphosphatase [Neisseria leonii]|uniref:dUTP diphosphatase n=1 Tax=Neisseria leonii TaxID=2995413 RepID=A0A9X4IEI6_9NEIS|nr:dUTP diphosphatase [Neisseria sp. 51.81]MDD9328227.1 dUTP diphosphatase [Neisseria sp. 51.81]